MWMTTGKLNELIIRKLLFFVMVNAMSSLEHALLLSSGWGNGRSAGTKNPFCKILSKILVPVCLRLRGRE